MFAEVWVQFENRDDPGGCEPAVAQSTPRGTAVIGTPGTLVMYYMQEATSYCWRPVAQAFGAPVYGAWRGMTSGSGEVTTGALPDEIAADTLVFNVEGTPGNTQDVLFNYACNADAVGREFDWLVLADTDGVIRWYQDPSETVGEDVSITGLNVARWEGTVLAILDHDYVVEYEPTGEVRRLYCRDPDGGTDSCVDAGVVADAYFDKYIHHDVLRNAGYTQVLTAEQMDIPGSGTECGGGAMTQAIIDGVYVFDVDDDSLYEWTLADIYDPSYADETCDASAAHECDPPYWANDGLTGCDWAHANSIWDNDDFWYDPILSLKAWNKVIRAWAFTEPVVLWWELSGQGDADDWDFEDGSGAAGQFYGQHAARWGEEEGMLVFDNDIDGGGPSNDDTRGIRVAFDTSTPPGTATVVTEYPMVNASGATLRCETGGSIADVPSSTGGDATVLAFCVGDDQDGAANNEDQPDDPMFNEFDLDGNLLWTMEVYCEDSPTGGDRRTTPSYRGYANVFQP
jgi:hypothetical protein